MLNLESLIMVDKIKLWSSEVASLPKGSLYLSSSRGRIYFVHYLNGRRHGISNDMDLVYKLARKHYLTALIRQYRNALHSSVNKSMLSSDPDEASSGLHSPAHTLLVKYRNVGLNTTRISSTPEQYKWTSDAFRTNPYPNQGTCYESYNGVALRSKSEQTISNELESFGIPYRYESEVNLDVSWMTGINGLSSGRYKYYYPDFQIMLADGSIVIWEHLGRVDLDKYRSHTMEKISAYRQSGLVDDTHLILTFEKDLEKPETLRALISNRILPYV